jgi:uncharacterized protein YdiU (UPF0061 family)
MPRTLSELTFDDTFVRTLPGEVPPPALARRSRDVPHAAWAAVDPTPVPAPRLLAYSPEAAALLGLEGTPDPGEAAAVLSGNRLLPGMRPYAARYGGHQFGHWAGQLGDGRAITLGEVVAAGGPGTPGGQRWEVQLKGAGPTAFSRRSDGRAVLRSSLREFLCSEAMFHLGVPTTRALALVDTGEPVVRDMFYDGHPRAEPGAIVTRLAPTFVRLGHFEILAERGEHTLGRTLAGWLLTHHFPELGTVCTDDALVGLFETTVARTARMVSDWMHVGFVHGVMNTDNLSVLGLTIDYGPYGFTDVYDPDFTPNTTDFQSRRYRYGHQPAVAHWNLYRFAMALAPLLTDPGRLEPGLSGFVTHFEDHWRARMARRLGLTLDWTDPGDAALVKDLLALLTAVETDPAIFFRRLIDATATPAGRTGDAERVRLFDPAYYDPSARPADDGDVRARLQGFLDRHRARFDDPRETTPADVRRAGMRAASPAVLPRNYLAQEAIDAAERGDLQPLERLLDVCRRPYEDPADARYAARRPEWARDKAGCSALSCSS